MSIAGPSLSSMLPGLEESLTNLTVEQLKWLSRAMDLRPPLRKGELVEALVKTLGDAVRVRRLWAMLSPIERQVIAEVVHNLDGKYEPRKIGAKYPKSPSPSKPDYGGWGTKREAAPFDLFFCHLSGLGAFVPREIGATVRSLASRPAPMQLPGSDEPPTVRLSPSKAKLPREAMVVETERAVFHDLAATLYLAQAGKIGVGATGLPTLASLRQMRPHLLTGDYLDDAGYDKAEDAIRPLALVVLVQAAKWATPSGAKGGRLGLTKNGRALMGAPLEAHHIRYAWESWLKSDILDELSRIRNIKGQQSGRTRLTKPAERRQRLAEALSACPVGRWVKLDEFFRYLMASGLDPDVERNDVSGLYVGWSMEYGWLGYSNVDYWNIVVGSYLRALLMEYVATLGIVDISHIRPEDAEWQLGDAHGVDDLPYLSRYDGLLGFRLTSLGAYVLGLSDQYVPPTVEHARPLIKILSNLDLIVTDAAAAPGERAFLERIGVEQSQDVYRLNRDKLIEGVEHGLTIPQVVEFLCAKSGLPEADLPQTVRVFMADAEKRLMALREGGKALVLEADDGYLLTELAHHATLRAMVRMATVDGKPVLLVPEEREAAVRRQLKKLGYLPRKGI